MEKVINLNKKIFLFSNENLDNRVKNSLSNLADEEEVSKISCLPDIYQKEHTKWPSGITVETNRIILPELLEGIGCGISIFKLSETDYLSSESLDEIMTIVSSTIKNEKTIHQATKEFQSEDTIIDFENYLKHSGIPNLEHEWRNDTNSRSRFPNFSLNTFREYVKWPPANMGNALIEGNHFIEIQRVEEIYDSSFAEKLGLSLNDLLIMIHLESEGLNIEMEEKFNNKYNQNKIAFPSKKADEYITLSNISQRHCFMNRIIIAKAITESLKEKGTGYDGLSFVFETTHTGLFRTNSGKDMKIYHHTGTTPAFPPGSEYLHPNIRLFGQALILPGALGTESYIMKSSYGTPNSSYTVNHGLGRRISKAYARANYREEDVAKTFHYSDIVINQVSGMDLVSQVNTCYKNIDEVSRLMEQNNLTTKVAKVRPLGIIKG